MEVAHLQLRAARPRTSGTGMVQRRQNFGIATDGGEPLNRCQRTSVTSPALCNDDPKLSGGLPRSAAVVVSERTGEHPSHD